MIYGKIINRQDHFYRPMQAKEHIDCLKAEKLKKLEDRDIQGAVGLLKTLLYDPAHLIPELLQNAKDAGADHVRIQLDENRMLFQHNGARFETEHVNAICGIGQSTKKGSLDYIGTFGVGFKSTFAVSKNPEIHSGGYSFRFDDKTVIAPEWISPEDAYTKWNVTIVLPLKDKLSYESVLKQLERFEENYAKPMIFFGKLVKISIQRNDTKTLFEKGDVEISSIKNLGDNFEFVEIKKNGVSGKCFCAYTLEKTIPPDMLEHVRQNRKLKLEEGIEYKTSVKIAFEIGREGHVIASTGGLLSAFLPTKIRTFLAFDVNAGFLLSPDREKLNQVDDKYNCWLLKLSVVALQTIIELYKERAPKEFWPDIYRLFPMQMDVREKWIEEQFCTPIKDYFRKGILFLVSDVNNPWRQFNEVVEAPEGIRSLFPAFSELEESGRRAYLSEVIDSNLRKALVKEFELTEADEIFLLDALARRDILKGKEAPQLFSLFALLGKKYSSCSSYYPNPWNSEKEKFLSKAKQCYLIPCEDGSIVRPSEDGVVYRSASGLPDFLHSKILELKQELYKMLPEDIKEEEPRERQQHARDFVWELTKAATPENLYNYIIRQEFEKAGDGELSEQVCESLDNYALFLKGKNVAKGDIKLRIKGKREYRKAENLYFANSYLADSNGSPLYDIEKLLSGCDDVLFVSPHYLDLETFPLCEKMTGWKEFLMKCNVRSFPRLEQNSIFDAKNKEEFEKKFQKKYRQQPPQLEGSGRPYSGNNIEYKNKFGYDKMAYRLVNRDFANNFKSIMNSRFAAQDINFFLEFLKMLDCEWDILEEHLYLFYFYNYANVAKQEIRKAVLRTSSSLSEWLQEMKWLPARPLPDGGMELRPPSEVYLFTPETEGIKGGFYIEPDRVRSRGLRTLLGLRTVKPAQETASSHEETIDVLLEKYGRCVADCLPFDKEMEKFIKKLYLRVNDAINNGADDIQLKLKTYMTRVYDASRNWNDLSRIHYYVSDVSIINDLRDDIKRDVLFLPGGLDPDSIKPLLTELNKRDLLFESSRVLPENVRSREEETPCFRDLANALWSFLKEEKDRERDELKTCCQKIAEIQAYSTQNLCYRLHRETGPISNWIVTNGILHKDIFWFSGDLRDLNVQIAKEICMEFDFKKPTKDFIKEVFSRSIKSMTISLKDRGKEYDSIIKEKPKITNVKTTSRRPEAEPPLIVAAEKDIPIEEVKPIKVEVGVLTVTGGGITITHRTNTQGHSAGDQHGHTREETGRRGEEIMEKKILPENFPDCKIKYVDESEYDFIVESPDRGIIYIEVKSSGSDEREFSFEMSEEQRLFAEQQGESYQLWFVMNAWDAENPHYMGPCNYNKLLENGSLRMDPVHKTIYKCTVAVAAGLI